MAYSQGSPHAYRQHSRLPSSPPLHDPYNQNFEPSRHSFEEGDDRVNTRGYEQRPLQMPSQEQFLPQRSYTAQNNYNTSAQPSVTPGFSSYNPQQYARTTLPYTSPIQTSSLGNTSPRMVPQAYNPAAYATPTQTTGYEWSAYTPTETTYTAPQPGPPVPPRPYEYSPRAPYGQQSSIPARPYQTTGPPLPVSPQSTLPAAYTPPAPPPPPFSISSDISMTINPKPYSSLSSTTSNPTALPNPHFSAQANAAFPNPNHRLPPLPQYPTLPTYQRGTDIAKTPEPENDAQKSPAPSPSPYQPTADSSTPQHTLHSSQRSSTSNRHPQRRPLPEAPKNSYGSSDGPEDELDIGVDDLLDEVEATVMGQSPANSSHRSPRMQEFASKSPNHSANSPEPLFSRPHNPQLSPDTRYSHTNGGGNESARIDSTGGNLNYDTYSDDDDAEAAAGLAAMQMAEEQEAAEFARRNTFSSTHTRQTSHGQRENGGSLGESYSYGLGLPVASPSRYADDMATVASPLDDFGLPPGDSIHPFPAFSARTDTGGSGGLVEPATLARRLSFEDGDEATLVDHEGTLDHSSNDNTARNSVQSTRETLSRHGSRPLPRIPDSDATINGRQNDLNHRPGYPQAPDEYGYGYSAASAAIQKARSVGNTSHTPQVIPPGRSITDAERRKRGNSATIRNSELFDNLSPEAAAAGVSKLGEMTLPTLPSGRSRKFIASKLTSNDFKLCEEPWAHSSILAWLREMTSSELDLKEQAVVDGLVALFTHKVPTMNTADAEVLSSRFVEQMLSNGALTRDEEWVRLGPAEMTGVLYQLTGSGCYSSRSHTQAIAGRCYSYHCMRTLKKLDLQTRNLGPVQSADGWAEHYGLKKADIENKPQKEIERQYNLHEIITGEDRYMEDLSVLQVLYRDGLTNSPQPIISPQRMNTFLRDVFGKVDAIKKANEEYLLPQLKYRQKVEGPWIKGFSDIFREWSRKARVAYVDYAVSLPRAILKYKKEAERNVVFKQFLDQVRSNERSRRLELDSFLKAPIARLQRYGLLLQTVLKHTTVESEEKSNLIIAIEEVKTMTLECDTRFAEQSKCADLEDLSYKLVLRPGMEKVQLNLTHRGREIVHRGDLQRRGKGYSWLDTHGILFDHYLVLAKPVQNRDGAGGLKKEVYDVSKLPIPMDLLVLESTNDDPVVKSSVKGVTTLTKPGSATRPETLVHMNTNTSAVSTSSGKSLVTTTVLESPNERVLYPFRVKHLGKTEVYTLYASTPQSRAEWCDKIIVAKTRHAASLSAQNAEPFKLKVLADTAFAFDSQSGGPRGVVIKGTPLDRAIEECDRSFYGKGTRPGPVCRASVNCAVSFNSPRGARMVAVGTDFGVYVSEYGQPRSWTRTITATHVTQIAVLEDFSLCIIIAEKVLIAYHLDTVCQITGTGGGPDSRKAPQKLSGNRDVGFFACAKQKDRTLVVYKKKDGISSTFKVLEPVYQKSITNSRSRFAIRKGPTDFFRDFEEFYIPSETYAINLFQSSIAVSSVRGIEVLTLDKKVTLSVPDLRQPEVAPIAQRLQGQRPLGMFRLSDNEFLLVFEEVGIYVDKHGDVSRAVVMEFVGKAKQACLFGSTYLILVDAGSGFVEVRNANNGRLRQIISGRDVKLLDDGATSGTVKISMQHSEQERYQVVLELLINEDQKE